MRWVHELWPDEKTITCISKRPVLCANMQCLRFVFIAHGMEWFISHPKTYLIMYLFMRDIRAVDRERKINIIRPGKT